MQSNSAQVLQERTCSQERRFRGGKGSIFALLGSNSAGKTIYNRHLFYRSCSLHPTALSTQGRCTISVNSNNFYMMIDNKIE